MNLIPDGKSSPAPPPPPQSAAAVALAGEGDALAARGELAAAMERYRQAMALAPDTKEYHRKLARAAARAEDVKTAERHLLHALRLDPVYLAAHDELAKLYVHHGPAEAALRHSAAALALAPDDPDVVGTRAAALIAAGQVAEAWDLMRPWVERSAATDGAPLPPRLAHQYAELAAKLGGEHEPRAVELVRRTLAAHAGPPPAITLHFAAASLLDRLGRYDEAFEHARQANEAARATRRPFNPAAFTEWVNRHVRYFTPEQLHVLPRANHKNRRPVFIVGMPRSGTSLVEQILASHPAVFGAGELPVLGRVGTALSRGGDWAQGTAYPESLECLSVRVANRFATDYLTSIRSLNTDATYVTDKMPTNGLALHLVELLLPGCHVIHCRRDPMDTCLSCYFTDFAAAHEFTHDLNYLGAYHREYDRMVAHWKRVLSLPVLEVRYEEVVLEPEAQVRRMLEFLGLPWDDRCLKFHENRRAVHTASRDQVRRPVYASSIGRWRHYERHLAPLAAAFARPAVT